MIHSAHNLTDQLAILDRINSLETTGQHREAIAFCEAAEDGTESPEVHLAHARNAFALAVTGDEMFAWPALLAALKGIEKRHAGESDTIHALGICKWVIEHFADPHRLDARGFAKRLSGQSKAQERRSSDPPTPSIDELHGLHSNGRSVRLCNTLLTAAPITVRHGRPADEIAREAAYLLATVLASVDAEEATRLLAQANYPLPGDYEAQPYDRYLLTAALARERRRARSAPSMLITSLPKSASAFLSYTLAEALDAAVVRITIGDPMLGTVYAPWAADAAGGGCVLHDHFAASAANLTALRQAGIASLAVLVRDPRAAFWSWATMRAEYDNASVVSLPDLESVCQEVRALSDWIGSWIQAQADGFPVEFVHFSDLVASPEIVMGRLLENRGAGEYRPRIQEVLRQREGRPTTGNFRRGDDNAWRCEIPVEWHSTIEDAISTEVRKLLGLRP